MRTNSSDTLTEKRNVRLTMELDDNFDEIDMYQLEWKVGGNGFFQAIDFEILNNTILSCPASWNTFLSDECFNGQINVPIILTSTYNDSIDLIIDNNLDNFVEIATDTTIIIFKNIDELGQNFLRSQLNSLFIDSENQNPPSSFSNISNGRGVFYSVATKEFKLPSP